MGLALFNVPERAGRTADSAIIKKSKKSSTKSSITVNGGGGLAGRINTARAIIERNFGQYRDKYALIQDEHTLSEYITKCISNGIISIDTETTGLDPMLDKLVGISVYTPGMQASYIPINHRSYITNILCENQLPIEIIRREFQRIADANIAIIMFNASFDMRVMQNQVGVNLNCTWDGYLASRLLNENEGLGAKNLKTVHQKYCGNGDGEAQKFSDLFSGISFDIVPIKLGYLYAAHDAFITYELYEFQRPFLTATDPVCINQGLVDVAWVFHNIEMPCVKVVASVENTGVMFDMPTANALHEVYHKKLEEERAKVYSVIDMYKSEISMYKAKNVGSKLSEPINLDSPQQISALLYDIIEVKPVIDRKTKKLSRGTGEEIIAQIDHPLCKAILEYRGIGKLINTYIDKLPACVNPKDGRIHCSFNQYGADTGRFSSSDPNLQNIPSHNKDIRKMFRASDGYVLLSADYSQQEPKCLAALCKKHGDPQMYNTFMEGKDLYCEIASKAFNVPYDECKEFRADGTTNKEGKNRRKQAKSILLGVLYGRGTDSIAEQLGISRNEAQKIKDSVFKGFPAIKKFEEDSIQMSKECGFVTTVCGRKRRLPSMMLPDYEIKWKDGVAPDDDPLDFADDDLPFDNGSEKEVPDAVITKWLRRIQSARFKEKYKVFEAANAEGVWIVDNTRDKDVTKVVNARIQGSAADLSKLAMIELYKEEKLRDLGFRILITVHDEIIGECPKETADECARLLAQTMSDAAEIILEMPIKCDVECSYHWFGESITLKTA